MAKYTVYFNTKDGDYDKAWCTANSKAEAIENICHEYWNFKSVIHVVEE